MKINKKASRNKNLYVFSHEHHHTLVFSVRLKKASKTNVETLKKFINHFWSNSLEDHFKNEEKLFLKYLKNTELRNQFLAEHKQINSVVSEINSSDENIIKKALELSELLKLHVKFEEKLLFPWLQDNIETDKLDEIGKALESIVVKADDFEPKFWV